MSAIIAPTSCPETGRVGTDDLSKATVDHVHRAIYDFLLPSDKTFLEGMEATRQTGRKKVRKPVPVLPDEPLQEPQEARPGESNALPGAASFRWLLASAGAPGTQPI